MPKRTYSVAASTRRGKKRKTAVKKQNTAEEQASKKEISGGYLLKAVTDEEAVRSEVVKSLEAAQELLNLSRKEIIQS